MTGSMKLNKISIKERLSICQERVHTIERQQAGWWGKKIDELRTEPSYAGLMRGTIPSELMQIKDITLVV
jgi:hypothetical protein